VRIGRAIRLVPQASDRRAGDCRSGRVRPPRRAARRV